MNFVNKKNAENIQKKKDIQYLSRIALMCTFSESLMVITGAFHKS